MRCSMVADEDSRPSMPYEDGSTELVPPKRNQCLGLTQELVARVTGTMLPWPAPAVDRTRQAAASL